MYSGVKYPIFYIYEPSNLVTPIDEISFENFVLERNDSTPFKRIFKQWENPFTRKVTDKFIGYRYEETIKIGSPHCDLDIDDYLDKQSNTDTEYEIHALIRLIDYSNAGKRIKINPHADTEELLESYNTFFVICEITDWGSKSISGRMDWGVLKVTSESILDSFILPMPILPPRLVSPSAITQTTRGITFVWLEPAIGDTYELRFSKDPTFETGTTTLTDLTGTSTYVSDKDSGTWYWSMRTLSGSTYSDWSDSKSFTIDVFYTVAHGYTNYGNHKSPSTGKMLSLTRMQIAFWIKISSTQDYTVTYPISWNGTSSNDMGGIMLWKRTGETWYLYSTPILIGGYSPGSNYHAFAPVLDAWFHLAIDFDGSLTGNANRWKVYVNGVKQTTTYGGTIAASTSATRNSYDLQILGGNIGCWIDNIKLNRVANFWSESDILADYRAGSGAGTDQVIAEHFWNHQTYTPNHGDPTRFYIVNDTGSRSATDAINLSSNAGAKIETYS